MSRRCLAYERLRFCIPIIYFFAAFRVEAKELPPVSLPDRSVAAYLTVHKVAYDLICSAIKDEFNLTGQCSGMTSTDKKLFAKLYIGDAKVKSFGLELYGASENLALRKKNYTEKHSVSIIIAFNSGLENLFYTHIYDSTYKSSPFVDGTDDQTLIAIPSSEYKQLEALQDKLKNAIYVRLEQATTEALVNLKQ